MGRSLTTCTLRVTATGRLKFRMRQRRPHGYRGPRYYRNLVKEAGALFGSRHYRSYHFLLTMSDHIASFGLEHHESSDDRVGERALVDEAPRTMMAALLPHEFT